MKHKIVGKVSAPDGRGEMTKVILSSPGGADVVWYTRLNKAEIAGKVAKLQYRLEDKLNG